MPPSKHLSAARSWVLPVLGILGSLGCSGSSSATLSAAGTAGASTTNGGTTNGGTTNGGVNRGVVGGAGGNSGDGAATHEGAAGSEGLPLCKIELQTFEDNGYRSCAANDSAEVAGDCGPEFDNEYGATEVCGSFRIHAYGHAGRIGCAYDSATGDLVGGFLYGIPVPGMSCRSYFAGPADLAACPVPTAPFCGPVLDGGSAEGGAGGASEGGAGGRL
jgi:hypothetical protein